MATIQPLNEHTWATFVRPAVKFKAYPDTRKLIEQIMPYYPKSCHCIAGYLNDEDQFWKVNYHWELLTFMLAKALALKLSVQSISTLQSLQEQMLANPPDPVKGYKDSPKVGEPHDRSSHELITSRWKVMKSCKAEFRKILDAESIPSKNPPSTPWDLAAAPVAQPGTSKHGCGYAVDIEGKGKNALIKSIAKSLGATLAFDEKSHVHVEFKQGVIADGKLAADDSQNGKFSGFLQGSLKVGPLP